MSAPIGKLMTDKQRDLIQLLQRKLHLSDVALAIYCQQEFNTTLIQIDRRQASTLIDTMKTWESTPADLQRAMGQRDLFAVQDGRPR